MLPQPPHPQVVGGRALLRRLVPWLAAVLAVVGAVVWLVNLRWTEPNASPVAIAILNTVIIGGPVPIILNALSVAGVLFLLARRPTKRRAIVGGVAVAGGALVALVVFWVSTATDAFGLSLSNVIGAWAVVSVSSVVLALVSFAGARWWRRLLNAAVIVIVILAAIVGVNGDFGLDPTVAALAGVSTAPVVVLPPTAAGDGSKTAARLWATWRAPADLPAAGRTEQVMIPATVSGFVARPAGLYLPPAALIKNPPALPFVIMMMGQPGNPDASFQAQVLDRMAAAHHGLAPIVLVADQIGNPNVDTLCLDTKAYGNAQTYIYRDVVSWARTHLHIDQDPAHWVVAGYSNGGECAAELAAKYPGVWGNVIDIAGEEYEGWQLRHQVVATVFHGNWAAYSATWPITLLAARKYPDTAGVFTVATNDPVFRPQSVAVSNAARKAGWKTTFSLIANAGHGEAVLVAGLAEGYKVLYPRLGLAAPSATSKT